MATAAKRAVLQTALLSVQGLRRRRLGHIGPNHYQHDLDKWGRKLQQSSNGNGMPSNLLAAGGSRRPAPRASLVLGGESPRNRRKSTNATAANGLSATAASSVSNSNGLNHRVNGSNDVNGSKSSLVSNMMEQQRTSMTMTNRSHINGFTTKGLNGTNGLGPKNGAQLRKVNGNTSNIIQHQETSKPGGRPSFDSDLVVVLDMDECLIHSQFLSDQLVDKYRQVEDRPTARGSGNNEEAFIWNHCDSFRINLPDGDLVNVNKRPNLDLFLREITSKFETYIFTAAMPVYAAPVLDKLDPNGDMFRGRLYREHCVYDPEMGAYGKDLRDVLRMREMMIDDDDDNSDASTTSTTSDADGLPWDERRVVLVDNNPLSFIPNPSNGILVSSFYDDPKDDTLEAVMELLHELDDSEDVRPILDDKFGLKDALDDVVKGATSMSW